MVEDGQNPIMRHFPAEFSVTDEIYQLRDYSRDRVRVLARLDESRINQQQKGVKRTDGDFAVAWIRHYGKGRVFYSTFGHREDSWNRPDVQKMWTEAIRWALRMTEADATPRPRPGN
jgi:type 1 glutamine amidotransferase